MNTQRNKLGISAAFNDMREALQETLIRRPLAWIGGARERMRDLPKTNFDLGCKFADEGKWMDAAFRFRVAAYFQPNYPQVWYNLGCCYFHTGKLKQAEEALKKALQQNPNQQDVLFMLATVNPASLRPEQRPQHMPAGMVNQFFTSIAKQFDIEEARNKYQGGKVIHEFAKPLVKNISPVVLDLACGTGIAARPWRAVAREIIGVDSTSAMLALADKATHSDKKLFDQLIKTDAMALPATIADGSADVVLCVNSAQFMGELSGLMQSAARVMQSDGVFVMTAEPYNAAQGYGLSAQTGRFGHSPAYVKQAAHAAGLKLVKEATVPLYADMQVQAFAFGRGGA